MVQAQPVGSRDVLPIPETPFAGALADNVLDAVPTPIGPVQAPEGAPNVLLFMSDDVGFAMASTFGGPVPTPNFDRLAAMGVRYNRFHTTGVCSPSRAALLTGRNHHNAGVGYLSDLPNGFPGYGGKILRSTASIAQVLTLNGYNSAMFGKHHNVPTSERGASGPYDSWPLGLGFEHFFGFVGGDSDQFRPILYRDNQRVSQEEPADDILEQRITDDVINWLHNQQAVAPDKPFLIYLAPGSTHAPHQVPADYVARFRGQFDHGWDEERHRIFQRQQAMGMVPEQATLTARPGAIMGWDSLGPRERAFAARSMEVAAAQLAFQDLQLGRIIDELDRTGELDNTLIAIVSGDNGGDAGAGNGGTINELRTIGDPSEPIELLYDNLDNLGGPDTYGNYPAGWAWAMNAPYRWAKHQSSMLGAIRNGMILAWPGHVANEGSICSQFGHVIDIVPTILEAADLPAPDMVLGTQQKPLDGQSLLASLQQCDPDHPRTQYFEINGEHSLYHNGWFLSGENHRLPWEYLPPGGARPEIEYSLYDLNSDFSQERDLSATEPEQFASMLALWRAEAERNNVFPLDHRFAAPRARDLHVESDRRLFDFWGKNISIPANLEPRLVGRSFTIRAQIMPEHDNPSGVIVALGSQFGGWSLYLDRGRPAFFWAGSTNPTEMAGAMSDDALPSDVRELVLTFAAERPGGAATVLIEADGIEYLQLALTRNVLRAAGGGETLDIGRDLGVPVTIYNTPDGEFEGEIPHVEITLDQLETAR